LRRLPSVDRLLQGEAASRWVAALGRDLVVEACREALEAERRRVLSGEAYAGEEALWADVVARLQATVQPTLRPVINASGVVIQTNLGRSPLSEATLDAMRRAGEGYSNLEYDLATGERGSRYVHAEALLTRLTGAEAGLLVNNNAGAVLLALSALARGREVIISRGQLVEIGGGFRIPDVMAQSGARLVEVGTTNRTYASDYRAAITGETAALMRVHSSNFRVIGFTHQPTLDELVALAHERGLPLIDDLGSGTLLDTAPYGLAHEPTVQESVAAGADVVTFSGDKLLGGPQAGFIVGRADLIARINRNPLKRALRLDKIRLAAIEATLRLYRDPDRLAERLPTLRMLSRPQAEIAAQAQLQLLTILLRQGGQREQKDE